jgi:ribosomal protein S12 methylthiotransferase accessory factor
MRYDAAMIIDGIPYRKYLQAVEGEKKGSALASSFAFLERVFGITITYDAFTLPVNDPELVPLFTFAEEMRKKGICSSLIRASSLEDEPRLFQWSVRYAEGDDRFASGASLVSQKDALLSTLAEAMERAVWFNHDDFFQKPTVSRTHDLRGAYLDPARFAGFSTEERAKHSRRKLDPDAQYLWIRGTSLIHGRATWIPAQTMSPAPHFREQIKSEPIIRQTTTNGLATWPTLTGAQVRGIRELVERDAYMIMWFNQLSLPRTDLGNVPLDSSLGELLSRCKRYRLKVHAIQLLTDAPVHAICVLIEDAAGHAPRFSVGLKASRDLSAAILGATTEALRARNGARRFLKKNPDWHAPAVDKIGHRDRVYFWATEDRAKNLEFMVRGPLIPFHESTKFQNDEEELEGYKKWCQEKNYECVTMPLDTSSIYMSPASWHTEMIVMPEMQPMHLTEEWRMSGSSRIKDIPTESGLTARSKPFTGAPHPFS